jgi:hypothetical protein
MRLLNALSDSELYAAYLDSLRSASWSKPDILLWRDEDIDVMVASRRRAVRVGDSERFVQEQLVIAERPADTQRAFTVIHPWNSVTGIDETSSEWVEAAARLGPARRFTLQFGYAGNEVHGGWLLVRSGKSWLRSLHWSSGC